MKTWADRVAASETKARLRINSCGHYGGCGCSAYKGCCRTCPFPICTFDNPSTVRAPQNLERDIAVCNLRLSGVSEQEVADRFGVSIRSVSRIWADRDAIKHLTDVPESVTVS